MKSRKEIEKLKKDWLCDPIWDIEDTEGFEDHREELKKFSDEQHKKWESRRLERLKERAEKMGIPDNLKLANYIDNIEHSLNLLSQDFEILNSSQSK